MINASELRIGSKVCFSPSGKKDKVKPRWVTVIRLLNQTTVTDDDGIPLELFYESASIQPIKLTREVFEVIGSTEMIDHNGNRGVWKHPCGVWLSDVKGGGYTAQGFRSGRKIYYLHEYQNLVQILTGEELEIKDKTL